MRDKISNSNLAPLRHYLRTQVGRPWNKVYGEIASRAGRSGKPHPLYRQLQEVIAIHVAVLGDRLIDLASPHRVGAGPCAIRQELYVDPCTGLIRRNESHTPV